MKFDVYNILYLIIIIFAITQIFIAIWLNRGKPPKEIISKYPKTVMLSLPLPFVTYWRNYVEKEDIIVMERYRNRLIVWCLSFIIPFIFISICIYFL
jgi:hypothetical protein